MLETQSGIGLITVITAGRTLASATAELSRHPNRTTLAEFEQARWNLNRFAMGLSKRDVAVDDCPGAWTDDQVRKFTRTDLGLFLPETLSTAPEGLSLQVKVYPSMRWDEQGVPASVQNTLHLFGWMRTEKSIDAPHIGTDETEAIEIVKGKSRLGQTLNVYGEASQVSKLLQGKYLDEVKTWVRVLESQVCGRVVLADFDPGGDCGIGWGLDPLGVCRSLGVRSVGV